MPEEEKIPHVCLDMVLPPELQVDAAERAVEENPSNLPVFRHRPGMGVAPSRLQLALVTGKKWQNGRTLHVRFLDGLPQIQAKVKQFAMQWTQHANIKLEFDNSPDAEIRIAFQRDGSWSYIGTDDLVIPKNQATMNFGWFTTVHRRTRRSSAPWCTSSATRSAASTSTSTPTPASPGTGTRSSATTRGRRTTGRRRRWRPTSSRGTARRQTQFSAFDPKSIMLYPVDNALTIGNFEIGWNKKMSDTDKQFIGVAYPFDKPVHGGGGDGAQESAPRSRPRSASTARRTSTASRSTRRGSYRFETRGAPTW